MANKLNGFLDNLTNGVLNPKGNMGDFQHAARLFTDDFFRLAPKNKFVYHVVFNINPAVPNVRFDKLELNMLVKSAELPRFNLDTSVVNQYNRKRIVTSKIDYEPVSIVFHDDNNNTTTDMWKAYYKYMIADGNYQGVGYSEDSNGNPQGNNSAYSLDAYGSSPGAYGLDYNTAGNKKRFFTSIQISQLSRHRHFTYTLINPVIASWQHDTVTSSDSGTPSESSMSIAYEAVIYHNPGTVRSDTPAGFADRHYDKMPSPITPAGGGSATLFGPGGVVDGVANIFDLVGSGQISTVGGLVEAIATGVNTVNNFKQLNSSGLAAEGKNILSQSLQTNVSVSGLTDTVFPTTSTRATTSADLNTNITVNAGSTAGNNVSEQTNSITTSIKKLDDFTLSTVYTTEYISEFGDSDINTISSSYQALSESRKQDYRNLALENMQSELKSK